MNYTAEVRVMQLHFHVNAFILSLTEIVFDKSRVNPPIQDSIWRILRTSKYRYIELHFTIISVFHLTNFGLSYTIWTIELVTANSNCIIVLQGHLQRMYSLRPFIKNPTDLKKLSHSLVEWGIYWGQNELLLSCSIVCMNPIAYRLDYSLI